MGRIKELELVYLDTHVIMWLYDGLVEILSQRAQQAIENGSLWVSPIVELELAYLREIGRLKPLPHTMLQTLAKEIGLKESQVPFQKTVQFAQKLDWTRDPFDRILVGEVLAAEAKLITRDKLIRENFAGALW